MRFKPRSVQASISSSFILLDDRQLFYMGKSGVSDKHAQQPTKFAFEGKFFKNYEHFTPLRVECKWSKIFAATYVTFMDFRGCKQNNNVKEKIVKKVNESWNKVKSQILPPQNNILAKYINYKYL